MKSIIGIPKGLLYYRYSVLWKTFFDVLEVPYIVSESSNHETLEKGKNLAIDETCLSLKLFLGQVEQLKDKCDILFIPTKDSKKPALIIELKWDKKAKKAIEQIEEKQYVKSLEKFKYHGDVLLVGISYQMKNERHDCKIKKIIV